MMRTLPLIPLLDLPVFRTAEEQFRGAHVLLAAVVSGEWVAFEQEARESVACERAVAVGATAISAAAVERAAREYRMQRGLATAHATYEWLSQWHLTTQDWMAHIRRTALRAALGHEAAALVAQYGAPEHDVARALPALFASSPEMARVARTLASRAAALATGDASLALTHADDATVADAHAALGALLSEPLPRVGFAAWSDADRQSALTTLARTDAAWTRFVASVSTPTALRDQLTAHRLDWVRVEYQEARFPSLAIANEAALCVRDDGTELAVIAAEAGVRTVRVIDWLDAESPARVALLLGAGVGDLLGPLSDHDEFALVQLTGKQLPSLDDPVVTARASHAALDHAATRIANDHIRWEVTW